MRVFYRQRPDLSFIIGRQPIAALIERADREFEALEIAGGEYAKF